MTSAVLAVLVIVLILLLPQPLCLSVIVRFIVSSAAGTGAEFVQKFTKPKGEPAVTRASRG